MDGTANFLKGMNSLLYRASVVRNVYTLNYLLKAKLNVLHEIILLRNFDLRIAVSHAYRNSAVGYELLRAKNSDGTTAVHLAAFHGHDKLVKGLLQLIERDVECW
ncbi:hypothetical protein SUGI_0124360 [Cryptomeria japonica]|nr:hypothetical protein SUGI_0124360 [Cryptomeria japonica]